MTNRLFMESVHPDDRSRIAEAVQSALVARTPYELEHRIVRLDGEERVVLEHAEFAYDDAGRPVRLVGAVQDITDRKRSEQALRESERRYSTFFEISPFAIALNTMPDGAIVAVNDAFLRLFEFTREEVVGKRSVELGISDADSNARVRAELQQHGAIRDLEVTRRTRSGTARVLSISADCLRLGGQDLVLSTVQDLTERKRAEEALRQEDRRKNEFLGVLSHELRNPLAPIRNSTYILRHADPGSDQARRAQSVIERQTHQLTRLVDDLLDVTRIARGKIELRRERVDLREVVRRTAEDFRSVIESRGITFRVDVPDANLWADVDQIRVGQAIGNLLHNAAKFTRRGDSVTMSLEWEGTSSQIRVHD